MKTRLISFYSSFTSLIAMAIFFSPLAQAQGEVPSAEDAIGVIDKTPGVDKFSTGSGTSTIGLIPFISTIIQLVTVIAGIWVLFNIILAGYIYVTSNGDTSAHTKVRDKITLSVIGLALIVATYTIIGIISLLLFGDAGYILSPTIYGITGVR